MNFFAPKTCENNYDFFNLYESVPKEMQIKLFINVLYKGRVRGHDLVVHKCVI